jgi:hypothetical protein
VVGVQEKVLAESAAAVLLGEQDQDAAVEQRWILPAPPGPVVGLGEVAPRTRLCRTILVQPNRGSQAPLSRLPKIHRSRLAGLNRP